MASPVTTSLLKRASIVAIGLACCALVGCIPITDNDVCGDDDDCGDDQVCTDVRECSAQDAATPWRVNWTVNGVAANSAGACELVDNIVLTISSSQEQLTYTPIACTTGSFGFRLIPVEYNTARVTAEGDGRNLDSASASGSRESGAELSVDLVF